MLDPSGHAPIPPNCVSLRTLFTNDPPATQHSLAKQARWRNVASKVCFVAAAAIFVGIAVVGLAGTFELAIPIIMVLSVAAVIVPGFFLKTGNSLMTAYKNILSQKDIIDQIVAFQKSPDKAEQEGPAASASGDASANVINWPEIQFSFWKKRVVEVETEIERLRADHDKNGSEPAKPLSHDDMVARRVSACRLEESELTTARIECAVAFSAIQNHPIKDGQEIGFYPPHGAEETVVSHQSDPRRSDVHCYATDGTPITHTDVIGRLLGTDPKGASQRENTEDLVKRLARKLLPPPDVELQLRLPSEPQTPAS
jgi:hypothetical protein